MISTTTDNLFSILLDLQYLPMRIWYVNLLPIINIRYIVADRYLGQVEYILVTLEIVVGDFVLDDESIVHFL